MHRFIQDFKQILSSRAFSAFLITICIIGRLLDVIFFYNLRMDHSFQVQGTMNFVNGHGVSLAHVDAGNLSRIIYEPLFNWPQGYSLLLSPLYVLFNGNYIAAGLTTDALFAILLILVSRRILFLYNTPAYLVNIFTFISSFFTYYFYFIASTDSIAIAFFLTGIYKALQLIKTKERCITRSLVMTLCLFATAFLKYQFFPIVFIIPVFLTVRGWSDSHIAIKKAGALSFILLGLGTGALFLYQKSIAGTMGYVSVPERGFFPENLKDAYPFIPTSFIKNSTLNLFFANQPKITALVYRLLQWLHLLSLCLLTALVAARLYKKKFRRLSAIDSFFYLGYFLSLGITALLALLSLRVAKEHYTNGVLWTYIEEPRYYGIATVLVHLSVFMLYHYYRLYRQKLLKYVIVLFITFLLPEVFRGIIFDMNRIRRLNREEYSWQYEYRFQKYADSIIRKAKKELKTASVVVAGSMDYMNRRVVLQSGATLLNDSYKINEMASLHAQKPVLLLVILYQKQFDDFKGFLDCKEKRQVGKFDDFYFYTAYVGPK